MACNQPQMTSGVKLPPGEAARRREERQKTRHDVERAGRAIARAENETAAKTRYLKAVSEWGTMRAGCKSAHVTPGTVLRWRETDDAFAIAEHDAREALIESLEAEAVRRARQGVQRPIYQGGQLAGYVTEYSDLLLQLLLRANRPEKYREKVDVAVTMVIKAISGVSPADVL